MQACNVYAHLHRCEYMGHSTCVTAALDPVNAPSK